MGFNDAMFIFALIFKKNIWFSSNGDIVLGLISRIIDDTREESSNLAVSLFFIFPSGYTFTYILNLKL